MTRYDDPEWVRYNSCGSAFENARIEIVDDAGERLPAEIEAVLTSLDSVSESCVMGYQDTCLGEKICAFVSLKKKGVKSGSELRNELKNTLSKYKVPDRIILLDEIPRLPNGKYDIPALSNMLKNEKMA